MVFVTARVSGSLNAGFGFGGWFCVDAGAGCFFGIPVCPLSLWERVRERAFQAA